MIFGSWSTVTFVVSLSPTEVIVHKRGYKSKRTTLLNSLSESILYGTSLLTSRYSTMATLYDAFLSETAH